MQIIYVANSIESVRANIGRPIKPGEHVIVSHEDVYKIRGIGEGSIIILCPNWQQLFTYCKPDVKIDFMSQLAAVQQHGTLIVKFVEFM